MNCAIIPIAILIVLLGFIVSLAVIIPWLCDICDCGEEDSCEKQLDDDGDSGIVQS